MKPVLIGAGSCIIEAILVQFATVPGLLDKVDLHLSQIVPGGRTIVPEEILARAVILIEEAAPWQGSGTLTDDERAKLPPTCATLTVPTLHFNSLWPLMTEDPRNQPEPGAPYGRIPFGMADRIALRIHQTEPDPTRRRALYDATDLKTAVNLVRSHELEIRNCFTRERGCDVRVAAFVMAYFREKRLYYTHNHPTGEMMYFVLAQLYALQPILSLIKLPYDRLLADARHWADTSNVFGGEEAPVSPAVAAHFGLKWWRLDHQYPWMDQRRDFSDWIDWYLCYVPQSASTVPLLPPPEPKTLQIGRYLAALGDTVHDLRTLTQSTDVARVVITVQDGLDPSIAPQSQLMVAEINGRYSAPATLLGALRDAIVIGEAGLVEHGGQLLGDTVRLFESGPKEPVVQKASQNVLILQPGVPAKLRHEAGPIFCGFAGGWRDYTLWTVASMPRLVAYCALRAEIPDLRVVLPRFAPASFQQASLRLLGIGPEAIIEIGATDGVHADLLYVVSALDLWQFSPYGYHAAQRIAALAVPATHAPQSRWVYLRGPVARAARNADEVAQALVAAGFRAMRLDDMPLVEQIAIMQHAECIVVENGPAIANLLYARRGTPVLELFAPADPQPLGWTIASQAGLPYGFVAGRPGDGGGYEFPLSIIHAALSRMMLATADRGSVA